MFSVKDLSFSYTSYDGKEGKKVLDNLSFSLSDKEAILILGESASGKSTLSLILSALAPAFFDGKLTGELLLDGKALPAAPKLTGQISLVPQDCSQFIITSQVEDEIVYPLESLGVKKEEMATRLEIAIKEWGLEKLRKAGTGELSGGEKRRLVLAASLITDPSIVIYDEAFDDLDHSWREKLATLIKSRRHASIVFASHYLPFFDNLFDKILILKDGTLKEGSSSSFKANLNFKRVESVKKRDDKLEAKNILFTHRRKIADDDLSFTLNAKDFYLKSGEIVTLTGANGSGKSTFSRLLCGLDNVQSGSFYLNGKETDSIILRRSVAYMFQNPDYQIFLPTVEDELSFSLDYLRLSKKEKDERVDHLCSLFSLNKSDIASLMSFGDRKRLQAAIYYNLDRPFIILDELDSALNYSEAFRVVSLLAERCAGILLITHDRDFASAVKTRGYKIEEGLLYAE